MPMSKRSGDFDPPHFRLVFGADGKLRIFLPEQVNEESVTLKVLASTELSDLAKEDVAEWTGAVMMQLRPIAAIHDERDGVRPTQMPSMPLT